MATAFDEHWVPRHDVPRGGRSGFTLVDGRQVHYLEWGHGGLPPVIALHGGGQTAYMYEELGGADGGRHHLLAPDLPAHGDSDALPPGIDMDRHTIAATIPALLDHFGIERAAFVGASLGGIVAITLGAAYPDRVGAVALVDIGHQLEEEGVLRIMEFMRAHESFESLDEAAGFIREFLPHRTDVTPERLTRNLRQRDDGRWVWKHGYGRALRQRAEQAEQAEQGEQGDVPDSNWRSLLEGVEDDARSLRCPVLLLRGSRSDVLSDAGADAFVDLIPHARLATVESAGHLAVGDNPQSAVHLIASFLDEVAR